MLHRGVFGTCSGQLDQQHRPRVLRIGRLVRARVRRDRRPGRPQRLTAAPSPTTAPIQRAPTNAAAARCWRRMGAHLARKLGELLFHLEVWNVGVTAGDHGVEEILRDGALDARARHLVPAARARPLHRRSLRLHHDAGDGPRVLVEDFDPAGKGRICELLPPDGRDGGARLELTAALEPPYHLSYPCTFAERRRALLRPRVVSGQRRAAAPARRRRVAVRAHLGRRLAGRRSHAVPARGPLLAAVHAAERRRVRQPQAPRLPRHRARRRLAAARAQPAQVRHRIGAARRRALPRRRPASSTEHGLRDDLRRRGGDQSRRPGCHRPNSKRSPSRASNRPATAPTPPACTR